MDYCKMAIKNYIINVITNIIFLFLSLHDGAELQSNVTSDFVAFFRNDVYIYWLFDNLIVF